MKAFFVLVCIGALMAAAYFYHPYFAKREVVVPAWSLPRSWQASDGRAFTGRLVAGMGEEGVFTRQDDGRSFRIKPAALAASDATMLRAAFADGSLPRRLDGIFHLRHRLEIPGQQASMHPLGVASIGPRIAKSDAEYWLFLTQLDGSSPQWVRVDGDAYRRLANDTLLPIAELANYTRPGGSFLEALAWPRTDWLLVSANYGLSARRLNVTRMLMGHISQGNFPRTLEPEMFQLDPHHPDVWDLVLTWVKPDGSLVYRTVRDDQIVTWP